MDTEQRFDFLAISSLVNVLAGCIVMTSLLFANARDIAQTLASNDLCNLAAAETAHLESFPTD